MRMRIDWLSVKIPQVLNKQLHSFAAQNGVTRHRAAYYILSLFFSGARNKIQETLNYESSSNQ